MKCTNAGCENEATKVMSWPMSNHKCDFVAPYCDKHADEVFSNQAGSFACGPALSDDLKGIEGIRR